MPQPLAELAEADASGEIAAIYAEMCRLNAVPYVSAMQRHLATRPGWLPWVWRALAPAFRSGRAQETAWRLAADVTLPPLPAIPRAALRAWGVDAAGEAAVATVCDSFTRVSPQNMVFAGLLRRLLQGERPGGGAAGATGWTPPPPLPPMPALPGDLDAPAADLLRLFQVELGAGPFVPSLYRLLARWPGLLAHLAIAIAPRLAEPSTVAVCDALAARIDAAVPAILADLPAPAAEPPADGRLEVLAVLATYRQTSPQLVAFARLIRQALPDRSLSG